MNLYQVLIASVLLLVSPLSLADDVVYVHTDALGSPVLETDESAQILRQVDYRAYGDEVMDTPREGPGYTGHYRDSTTGLVYAQQRYYDPAVGRLLSVDPVTALDNGDMRHFNRYAYAHNNPYKFTDPDGRVPSMLRDHRDAERHREGSTQGPASTEPTISLPTASGIVTSNFGTRVHPVTGAVTHHNGTDFRARKGDVIMSTQDGKVDSTPSGGKGGNAIIVQNSDGSMSGYAHTAPAPGVSSGASVTSGQVIGNSDGSGAGTAPHLHYTYRTGTTANPATAATKPVDPLTTQLKNEKVTNK